MINEELMNKTLMLTKEYDTKEPGTFKYKETNFWFSTQGNE